LIDPSGYNKIKTQSSEDNLGGSMRASESTRLAQITGAAQGLGKAMALGLIGQGLCVAAVDRDLAGAGAPIGWRDIAALPIAPRFKEVLE
jgi:hypothetical protein